MDADALLASLRRRFVLITALNWLPNGIGMAVLIVLMDSRGLPLGVTGLIVALYSLTTVLLELPTGGLADVISRRGVLAVSAGLGSLAFCGLAVAASAWQFGVLYVLLGMARALSSGPAEAWYVDSVKAVRPHADIRKGLAASQTAGAVSLGAGTIGGGALALAPVFPDSGAVTALSAPMLLSALLNVVLLIVVVTGMRETARPSDGGGFGALLAGVPRTIASGAALGVRDRALGRLLTTALPIGIAVSSVELLTPGRLLDVTGDSGASAGAYGVITAIGFAANAVGSAASGLLASLLGGGGARTAVAGTLVSALGLVALFTTGSLEGTAAVAAAAGGYALMFLGLGLRGPVHAELTHHRVDSGRRATVISVQSLLMQGGGSLAALTLPLLAGAWSIPGAWLVAGLILAASAALYLGAGTPPFAGRRAPDRVVEQGTAEPSAAAGHAARAALPRPPR